MHSIVESSEVAVVLLAGLTGVGACERSEESAAQSQSRESKSVEPQEERESGDRGSDEGDEHEHGEDEAAEGEHGDHSHEMRLGWKMQHIAHRYAAIWFAGRGERTELLDYHVHELRETIEAIDRAGIEEHGVKVGTQLRARVGERVGSLVDHVESGEQSEFRETYREVIGQCNECHDQTEHGFIEVGMPDRNPYANLRSSKEESDSSE